MAAAAAAAAYLPITHPKGNFVNSCSPSAPTALSSTAFHRRRPPPLRLSLPFQRRRSSASGGTVGVTVTASVGKLSDAELVPVPEAAGEIESKFSSGSGVYAVYDRSGVLQFIGLSRNLAASIAGHGKAVPDLCGSVKNKMRSMRGEVVLNIPAEKAWEMYRNNEILSKIDPSMLSCAEYLQGDGSPGSLRFFKFGPALHGYVKESKEKIEKVESGRSVTYRVVGGELRDMYDPYIVTFSFTHVAGGRCLAEWMAEFHPLSAAAPLPERAKDAALEFIKSFEKFKTCM